MSLLLSDEKWSFTSQTHQYFLCFYSEESEGESRGVEALIKKAVLASFYDDEAGVFCLQVACNSSVLIDTKEKFKNVFEATEFQEIQMTCQRFAYSFSFLCLFPSKDFN